MFSYGSVSFESYICRKPHLIWSYYIKIALFKIYIGIEKNRMLNAVMFSLLF